MPSSFNIARSPLLRLMLPLAVCAGLAVLLLGTTGCDRSCGVSGKTDAMIGGAFEAVDHHGNAISDKDLLGRYQLVFFGFTSCPDICPTELSTISTALDLLGDGAQYFQPVFATIDPARDTPAAMTEYLSHFHESFVGLTGTPEQIKDLAHVYRAYYGRSPEEMPDGGYNMDHSSLVYVMDCNGRYISHFSHGTSADQMAKRLQDLI